MGAPARLLAAEDEQACSMPPTKSHPLVRTAAWLDLGARSTSPLGDLLGAPVLASSISISTATQSEGALFIAATLVDPSHACEVVVSVVASSESSLEIGKQMLGPETTDAEAADALAEIVNVVAGVVKSAFAMDGFSLTLGLPGRLSSAEFQERQTRALARAAVNLTLGEHRFVLSYLLTQTTAVELPAEQLHEGYVLAEDFRDGTVILPICTRLTEGAARHIRETCRGMRVLVCPPMQG